jgi:hypothetical protein
MVLCSADGLRFLLIMIYCDMGNKCSPRGIIFIRHNSNLHLFVGNCYNNIRPEPNAIEKDSSVERVPI